MSCMDISNQLKEDKIGDVSATSVYRYKTNILKYDYQPPKLNIESYFLFRCFNQASTKAE